MLVVLLCREVLADFPPLPTGLLLPVVVGSGVVSIGPLVPASGGPCLRCLDLHRADRDEHWPGLIQQLRSRTDPHLVSADPPTSLATVAQVARIVHLVASGRHPPWGISWHWQVNDAQPVSRYWPPHPRCDCSWPRTPRQPDAALAD